MSATANICATAKAHRLKTSHEFYVPLRTTDSIFNLKRFDHVVLARGEHLNPENISHSYIIVWFIIFFYKYRKLCTVSVPVNV